MRKINEQSLTDEINKLLELLNKLLNDPTVPFEEIRKLILKISHLLDLLISIRLDLSALVESLEKELEKIFNNPKIVIEMPKIITIPDKPKKIESDPDILEPIM